MSKHKLLFFEEKLVICWSEMATHLDCPAQFLVYSFNGTWYLFRKNVHLQKLIWNHRLKTKLTSFTLSLNTNLFCSALKSSEVEQNSGRKEKRMRNCWLCTTQQKCSERKFYYCKNENASSSVATLFFQTVTTHNLLALCEFNS